MAVSIVAGESPLGHEVRGVRLDQPIADEDFRQIEEWYDTFGVLVFRDQELTPAQQVAFSRRFGPLDVFPFPQVNLPGLPEILVLSNIIEDGKPVGMSDAGRYWHTDMWYVANPPRGSMLVAVELPQQDGVTYGDTLYASTGAAYDALPAATKARIEGRNAVFSYAKHLEFRRNRRTTGVATNDAAQSVREGKSYPDIEHPLVKPHPRTGRKCLYLAEGSISHITGLDQAESDALIAALEAHVTRPEFVYRHHWRPGDVVMWDNASCLHHAIGDFALPLRRRMHRTTLA